MTGGLDSHFYGMDGSAKAAYTLYETKPDAAPVRLIVQRVKPTSGSQLALFARYSYHAFITDRAGVIWNWRPMIAATARWRTPNVTSSTASG